jgi:hypothetical protein
MPKTIFSPDHDSDFVFDGLLAHSLLTSLQYESKGFAIHRVRMNEPARGSRRPHQGQKRMNAHEVGQRQRGQRSGSAECDQTRLTLRLHSGQ